MTRPLLWLGKRVAYVALAVVGAGLALFVYSNVGHADVTHGDNLGWYTYPSSDCHESDADAGDPINVVFYDGATKDWLDHYFALYHGWSDNGGEPQYFKTYGNCYEMDGQPSSRGMGLSRYHARYHRGLDSNGNVALDPTWGDYSVAAAHYEDWIPYDPVFHPNCDSGWLPKGDHAVPEDGFNEGRDNVKKNWSTEPYPSHTFAGPYF